MEMDQSLKITPKITIQWWGVIFMLLGNLLQRVSNHPRNYDPLQFHLSAKFDPLKKP